MRKMVERVLKWIGRGLYDDEKAEKLKMGDIGRKRMLEKGNGFIQRVEG